MRNSQATALLFLVLAVLLFFFSLSLLPAVEHYCQFKRPSILLLVLTVLLLVVRVGIRPQGSSRALIVATYVFAIFAVAFNSYLLLTSPAGC